MYALGDYIWSLELNPLSVLTDYKLKKQMLEHKLKKQMLEQCNWNDSSGQTILKIKIFADMFVPDLSRIHEPIAEFIGILIVSQKQMQF